MLKPRLLNKFWRPNLRSQLFNRFLKACNLLIFFHLTLALLRLHHIIIIDRLEMHMLSIQPHNFILIDVLIVFHKLLLILLQLINILMMAKLRVYRPFITLWIKNTFWPLIARIVYLKLFWSLVIRFIYRVSHWRQSVCSLRSFVLSPHFINFLHINLKPFRL